MGVQTLELQGVLALTNTVRSRQAFSLMNKGQQLGFLENGRSLLLLGLSNNVFFGHWLGGLASFGFGDVKEEVGGSEFGGVVGFGLDFGLELFLDFLFGVEVHLAELREERI